MTIELTPENVASKIKLAFKFLRDTKREVSRLKSYRKVDIKETTHYEVLSKLQKCGIVIPTYIDKEIDVETVIFDCKKCLEKIFPTVYDSMLKNTVAAPDILTKFYSGSKKTYIKVYLLDIAESEAFKNMTATEVVLLLDMMRHLNFKASTSDIIQDSGFTYTMFDCKVNIPEDTFKRTVPKLIQKGFFKQGNFKKGRMNLYFPSSDWKLYKSV